MKTPLTDEEKTIVDALLLTGAYVFTVLFVVFVSAMFIKLIIIILHLIPWL